MASARVVLYAACVLVLILDYARATEVQACTGEKTRALKSEEVSVSNCTKPPCKLRRKSTIVVEVHFTPDEDVPSVKNAVHAQIIGVPFPFIGVDGQDACPTIFNEDGSKSECPLKAGQKYFYKGSFKVLEIYPRIRVNVVWALKAPSGKSLFCFQTLARIF